VRINPELWKYSVIKFMKIFNDFEGMEIASIRIYDEGNALLDSVNFGHPYIFKTRGNSDIVYNNVIYGRVEVDKISDRVVYASLFLLLFFCLIGTGTSFILFRYPAGIIKKAERRIEDMFEKLDIEIAERALEETALANSLKEKEILLKEIHHRVKNNLQLIASLLSLRMNRLEEGETRDLLQNIKYKVFAIARVHEHLYQSASPSKIDMKGYLATIVEEHRSASEEKPLIDCSISTNELALSLDQAMPLGLIVSELVIEIELKRTEDGRLELRVADDGIGMLPEKAERHEKGLGYILIRSLTTQLGGQLKIESKEGLKIIIDGIK
jgi:two-component sensor histidine kinase